jgi:hypothetical protein
MTRDNTGKKQGENLFPKGQSGNPKGRPPGTRNAALVALDAIGEENAKDILQAAVTAAKAGDIRAADTILSRIWPARKGRPIVLSLPAITNAAGVMQALARITEAASSGEITTDEAQAFAALVQGQRKAIETHELEQRIAALETKLEKD